MIHHIQLFATDSFRATGIVTFHSSQSFSIVPETANGGTFESSAVASTLNKISTINVTTMVSSQRCIESC